MAKKKSIFEDPQTMRDLAVGLGAGLRAFDPNNPLAGAGAAMLATSQMGMQREERDRERQERLEDQARSRRERLEDLAFGEQSKVSAEDRAEERRKTATEEANTEFDRRLKAQMESRAEERKQIREENIAAEEAERRRNLDISRGMGVHTLGGRTLPPNVERGVTRFKLDLASAFGGPSIAGTPPASFTNADLISDAIAAMDRAIDSRQSPRLRRRGMATDPTTGRTYKAIEDNDQGTPLYGPKGRDYAIE